LIEREVGAFVGNEWRMGYKDTGDGGEDMKIKIKQKGP
jgi:hypothetical protein